MEYVAFIVIVFTVIQLAVAMVNVIFRQKMKQTTNSNILVSVLIPARNEEHNIRNILHDLLEQEYNNIEVLVFDDQSTDRTAEIVTTFSQRDARIKLISSDGLPSDWLGKNFACHSLSLHARGKYFLFVDADVRIKKNVIGQTIYFAEKHKLNLVSVFPKQIMNTWSEHATVPIMNYILLTLLPLILVRKTSLASLAAANGQYMFFTAADYTNTLPHEVMKDEKVEDIKIARYYKQQRLNVACLASETDVKCRMYKSFAESLNGFSKNVTTFFGNSTLLAVLFWLVTTLGFIPILLVYYSSGLAVYILAVFAIHILVSITSSQSVLINIRYLLLQQVALGLVIIKSIRSNLKKEHVWKGRNIH
ncbi:MAG: glycosyltransferase [Candidatus Saccharimonadaceae bacterium]